MRRGPWSGPDRSSPHSSSTTARPPPRLAELGYNVKCFCYQDSPRRAHSIAAQGGINAAKNYQNDGDSIYRLFYDTVKGGDFRSREANVYRLARSQPDHRPVRGPGRALRREYGGLLANRSFGGAQVSRTFYARGQTGQQLLLGAYSRPQAADRAGTVKMYNRTRCSTWCSSTAGRGIVTRDLVTGKIERSPRRRGAGHRRLQQRLLPLDQRDELQRHGRLAGHKRGALLRQPLLHPDPPDLHPGSRRLSVQADADERVAAQRRPDLGAQKADDKGSQRTSPRTSATTTSSADLPELRQPGAARHRLAGGQGGVRRGPRRGPLTAAASTSTSPTPSSASARTSSRTLRQPLRHVRAHHRREPLRGADARSTPRRTTPWAACGWTTT
jgi:hypothetical protein